MNPIPLKIAYIGGGSRDWARKLMIDLALCPDLTGEVALYDIDMDSGAAQRTTRQLDAGSSQALCRAGIILPYPH